MFYFKCCLVLFIMAKAQLKLSSVGTLDLLTVELHLANVFKRWMVNFVILKIYTDNAL